MTPEEFSKAMQARQDKAIAQRSNLPSFSAQRVQATKSSQNDSRLIISCNVADYMDLKFVQTIWNEQTNAGNVIQLDPKEIAISVQGNRKMYISFEIVLARIFSHAAANGVQKFSVHGQWDKFATKSGNFTREEVMARDFSTLED